MPRLQESAEINSPTEKVFEYLDDIQNTGWHMTRHSAMMFGGSLELELISQNATGVGATYRWHGRVLGLPMDFSETVTRWTANREKVWRTVGHPKMVILSQYEMRFSLTPRNGGTLMDLAIDYSLPRSWMGRILGWLLARKYGRWCLRRMADDAKRTLENG